MRLGDVSIALRVGIKADRERTCVIAHLKSGEIIAKNLGVCVVAGVVPTSPAHIAAPPAAVLLL